MDELNYLDFDIHIQRAGTGYRVRVVNSPAGQSEGVFEKPFTDLEIENFVLRLGRKRQGVRRLESPEMEAARQFGGQLFNAVFSDELRGNLRSSLNEASQQDAGLRFRLHLADAPELADLPWEYLYDSTHDEFLVLSVHTPLVRYLDLPIKTEPLSTSLPLKILVMISSPSDFPALDVEKEYKTLVRGLGNLEERGLVRLDRLEKASLATLQRQIRKDDYHIFHFIGHGGYDEKSEDGILMLEDELGRGRAVSGRYLGTLLHDQKSLRLAILNACEGARTSRTDPFCGVAHSLVQKGIPAVIAMQFEIADEAAIVLAKEFYGAIADGYPVDASLAEARKAVFAQNYDTDWGTPVLYMRSPDGRIFGVDRMVTAAAAMTGTIVFDQAAQAQAESSWDPAASSTTDFQRETPDVQTAGGGLGGTSIEKPVMFDATTYPEKSRRSILPWLVGFVGVAALIISALIILDIVDLSSLIGPGKEPQPVVLIKTPVESEVIIPTSTATQPPTETPPPTVDEAFLPATGSTATPTIFPSPVPIGGGRGTIAYASDESGSFQIYTINADGSGGKNQITDHLGGACQPAWSPDGNKLVYISPCVKNQERNQDSQLFVIDINTPETYPSSLTEGYDPSWAPNDLILFTSEVSNKPNLYVIDPMGDTDASQLTQHSWNYRPDWSPDGTRIAFVSTRNKMNPMIFTMPTLGEIEDGGEQAMLFSRDFKYKYGQPKFSPDGEYLLYKRDIDNGVPDLRRCKLIDIGKKESTLATYQELGGEMNEVDYSPDGEWIAYELWSKLDNSRNIWIMRKNGSSKRPVIEDEFHKMDVSWQP